MTRNVKYAISVNFLFATTILATTALPPRWIYAYSQDEGADVARDIYSMYIANGVCESLYNCRKRQLVFFRRTSNGIHIELYEFNINKNIEKIMHLLLSRYKENKLNKTYKLSAYKETKSEVGLIKRLFNKPEVYILLKGN